MLLPNISATGSHDDVSVAGVIDEVRLKAVSDVLQSKLNKDNQAFEIKKYQDAIIELDYKLKTKINKRDSYKAEVQKILDSYDEEINYDHQFKVYLSKFPITFFCVHGNHEQRPETIPTYKHKIWHGGIVMVEDEFPNLIFACDAQVYKFNGLNTLVIGGAYSADKYYRLANGIGWWPDEQPSKKIKYNTERAIQVCNYNIDIVLSHTCPLKYEPIEAHLPFIDQNTVDKSTENWLDIIEDTLNYKQWYCGHWHINKSIDKIKFLFDGYEMFPNKKLYVD